MDLVQLILMLEKEPNVSKTRNAARRDGLVSLRYSRASSSSKDNFSSNVPTLKPSTSDDSLMKLARGARAKTDGDSGHACCVPLKRGKVLRDPIIGERTHALGVLYNSWSQCMNFGPNPYFIRISHGYSRLTESNAFSASSNNPSARVVMRLGQIQKEATDIDIHSLAWHKSGLVHMD